MPPLDQLQKVLDQVTPDNDFHNWVLGSYGQRGAYKTLIERLHEQSQRGRQMDIERLNKQFYDDIRLGTEKYGKGANDTQKAAIRAYLEQLRHPVTVEDVFGNQR